MLADADKGAVVAIFVGMLVKPFEGRRGLSGGAPCRWYINEDLPEINEINARGVLLCETLVLNMWILFTMFDGLLPVPCLFVLHFTAMLIYVDVLSRYCVVGSAVYIEDVFAYGQDILCL